VIQGGDPYTRDSAHRRDIWGTGGSSIFGLMFEDELGPLLSAIGYKEGVVAMANKGPNTNTSQFFIVLSDDVSKRLPGNFTIFGRVTKGMEIVHRIEQLEIEPAYARQGQPRTPAAIAKVTAVEVKPANR
jgi:peptidylprolyl isomerase/peptidyl-prolyl cis-trans isomerase-like 1